MRNMRENCAGFKWFILSKRPFIPHFVLDHGFITDGLRAKGLGVVRRAHIRAVHVTARFCNNCTTLGVIVQSLDYFAPRPAPAQAGESTMLSQGAADLLSRRDVKGAMA